MKYLNCHVVQSGSKPMFTTVHSITEDTSLRDGFTLRIHLASQLEGGQHQISIKTPLRNSIVRKVLQEIIGDDGNYIEYQFDRNSAALADGYYFIAYSHGSNKTETELLFKLSNTRLLSTLDSNSVKFVTLAENLQDLYYEHKTGKFFFLSSNGTQVPVDLPAEDVPTDIYLDADTKELVFELSNGTEKRVDVSSLIQQTSGDIILTAILNNQITPDADEDWLISIDDSGPFPQLDERSITFPGADVSIDLEFSKQTASIYPINVMCIYIADWPEGYYISHIKVGLFDVPNDRFVMFEGWNYGTGTYPNGKLMKTNTMEAFTGNYGGVYLQFVEIKLSKLL